MNAPFGGYKASSTQTYKEQAGDVDDGVLHAEKTVYLNPVLRLSAKDGEDHGIQSSRPIRTGARGHRTALLRRRARVRRGPPRTGRRTRRRTTAPIWIACSHPGNSSTTASDAPATEAHSTWRPENRSARRRPNPSRPTRCEERDGEIFVGMDPDEEFQWGRAGAAAAGRDEVHRRVRRRCPPAAWSASSHPAASFAGARVLADGGNAIDATLAMAAITWLTLPGQCGIGGDAFAIVREPDGSVWTVGGQRLRARRRHVEFYRETGSAVIPLDGALAVAVPGAPAALGAMHARWRHPLADGPVGTGGPAGRERATLLGQDRDDVRRGVARDRAPTPDSRAVYAPDGAAAAGRERGCRSPTWRGPSRHWRATCTVSTPASSPSRRSRRSRRRGAVQRGRMGRRRRRCRPEPAISGHYAGAVIHQTPLPTPGWMVLQQAALSDGVVGFSRGSASDAIDRMARAARLAFEDRFATCAAAGNDRVAGCAGAEPDRRAAQTGWTAAGRPSAPSPCAPVTPPRRSRWTRRPRGQLHPLARRSRSARRSPSRHRRGAQQPIRPRRLPDPGPPERRGAAA